MHRTSEASVMPTAKQTVLVDAYQHDGTVEVSRMQVIFVTLATTKLAIRCRSASHRYSPSKQSASGDTPNSTSMLVPLNAHLTLDCCGNGFVLPHAESEADDVSPQHDPNDAFSC